MSFKSAFWGVLAAGVAHSFMAGSRRGVRPSKANGKIPRPRHVEGRQHRKRYWLKGVRH